MEEMIQRLQRMERELCEQKEAMQCAMAELRGEARRLKRRACLQLAAAIALVAGALLVSPGSRTALAQDLGTALAELVTRVAALETKTQFITVSGGEMFIRDTNLHIQNGLGATNGNPNDPLSRSAALINGKGNLILGYNALRESRESGNERTGSHCLILGDRNNYSSFGGIVAGRSNTISAPYASVTGGSANTASGADASVSGGGRNTASGFVASVSGGNNNRASGAGASVSGGQSNHAVGALASVSGGERNSATGNFASVSGGQVNNAVGNHASISGGQDIRQPRFFGWSAGSEGGARTMVGNFRSP